MNRFVTVHIGEFPVEALAGERREGSERGSERVQDRLVRALRLYLRDREVSQPGWAYPTALPQKEGAEVELELAVDEGLWEEFEQEAERQGVTVSKLAGHAALYYVAGVDARDLTQDILDRLGDEESGGGETGRDPA